MGPWETLKSHSAIPGKCWVTKRLIFKIFNDSHFYIWGCSHELQQQRTTFRSWSSLYSRWLRGQTQMGKFGSKQSYPLSHLSPKACIFLKKNFQFQTLGFSQWAQEDNYPLLKSPSGREDKNDKAEFTKHERNCQGLTQGDPACCGDRVLRDTKSRKVYPFSLCSGLISSKGKFPRWCFHILHAYLSPCFAKAQSPSQKMVFGSHWIALCVTEFSFTITFSR